MKLAGKNIARSEIMLHAIFWLSWVVSFTLIQSLGFGVDEYFIWFMYYIVTLPVFMVHTYLIAYLLIPQTFFRGSYFLFVFALFVFLIVFSIIELVISNELIFKPFDSSKVFAPNYLNIKNIIISGIGNHYIILVFLAIKAGRSWYTSKTKQEDLMQSNMETELEIYRYQLQPILILSLMEELEEISQAKEAHTPNMIIKISNFLNRFLYEGDDELIPLQLEIKIIEEFLEIHKLGLGDRLISNFFVSGHLKSYLVPPFLLLPFLNDAIKLGYSCNESFESTVLIKGEKKYLLFSFSFWSEKQFGLTGNKNAEITRKRLNYSFPGKFRIIENIDDNFREFSIELFH
ncbi:histidine kinase [Maribellus maritimus]|uniref:histidine kinase n=1 Tax=Maribellus maritimus TaxID=2870838 RepID=UPI001EEC0C84|nr:histidine kinase [Maribellus maritimus]MCG6188067.1 histidine kinase [Maribellus maritimus]